jgi:hypothetical protein
MLSMRMMDRIRMHLLSTWAASREHREEDSMEQAC